MAAVKTACVIVPPRSEDTRLPDSRTLLGGRY